MTSAATSERISRDDLEASFRQVTGDVGEAAGAERRTLFVAGGVALLLLLLLGFLIGRRIGSKNKTVVEVRRL